MEICVQYNDWADCDACCEGPCSSCTDMIPISTTPPHDEANCESRAAGICNGSISNPGGLVPFHQQDNSTRSTNQTGGCSHDGDCSKGQECKNGECVGDPGMSIDVKRMQQLANIIKKNKR